MAYESKGKIHMFVSNKKGFPMGKPFKYDIYQIY